MRYLKLLSFPVITCIIALGCRQAPTKEFTPATVFESDKLTIVQVTENSYQHISFLQTNDFGKVGCNGLVVKDGKEAIVFDSPTDDSSTTVLLRWITDSLQASVKAVIPTHFHNDCLGGLQAFHLAGIASYAHDETSGLAKQNGYVTPTNTFHDSLKLTLGSTEVLVKFLGEGHTKDNVVGYFPKENVLFGGCLVKELNAGKGFLGDANVGQWSATVQKVKDRFPYAKTVVPGHGEIGNIALLDYTIRLFQDSADK